MRSPLFRPRRVAALVAVAGAAGALLALLTPATHRHALPAGGSRFEQAETGASRHESLIAVSNREFYDNNTSRLLELRVNRHEKIWAADAELKRLRDLVEETKRLLGEVCGCASV